MLSEIEVAKELLKINAIKLQPDEPFTWASGMKSPIYCDNRKILSYPALRNQIKKTLVKASSDFPSFEVVAGVAAYIPAHTFSTALCVVFASGFMYGSVTHNRRTVGRISGAHIRYLGALYGGEAVPGRERKRGRRSG